MLNFKDSRILVLGDVMLDEYIHSSVSRISPEAPVAVANIKRRSSVPGGAANVAHNLARLGCKVLLSGFVGMDSKATELGELLTKEGVESMLLPISSHPTICKTRVIAQGHQLLRLDWEDLGEISQGEYENLWSRIKDRLSDFGAVILSDYLKGTLRTFNNNGGSLASHVIEHCREKGIPVLVDPKGTDWKRYANATVITPNTNELAAVLNLSTEDYQGLCEGALAQIKRLNLDRIILTRSEKGMTILDPDGKLDEIRAKAKEVVDVSGAGDTVIAVLGACMANGYDWQEAAELANMAAGIVISKSGTSPIELHELNDAILRQNQQKLFASCKIFNSVEALQKQLDSWRSHGQKIVFTNGCFDLIHIGHVHLLHEAAAQGDKLIVALNSDASIKRLKGECRPMQSQDSRALILSAFQDVDAVIIFDSDTPLELIEHISPDVLVKGGDYQIHEIVGASHVIEKGGTVHVAKFVKGYSTSTIIEHIYKCQ